jgi:hypothetical protein
MNSNARPATIDDVNLILRLYEMRREARMREARRWFISSFKLKSYADFPALCPAGSEENASFRMLVTYYEMVASFMTSGVLHAELFYQSGREMLVVWERIRDLLPDIRKAQGNPLEYRNLETAGNSFIVWWRQNSPDGYDAFCRRIRG